MFIKIFLFYYFNNIYIHNSKNKKHIILIKNIYIYISTIFYNFLSNLKKDIND